MYGVEEEEMKVIRQFIPNATPEQVKEYKACMTGDAVLKGGLPFGFLTMVTSAVTVPSKFGVMKPIVAIGFGIIGYAMGKMAYSPLCTKQAFGSTSWNSAMQTRRDQYASRPDHSGSFDQEYNQSGYGVSADKLLDAESEWKTFDSHFDSDTNTFDDTIDHLQEDGTTGKRVTYDDLWRKHRNAEMQGQRRHQYGPGPRGGGTSESKQREKNMREDSGTFEAEIEESNWELK